MRVPTSLATHQNTPPLRGEVGAPRRARGAISRLKLRSLFSSTPLPTSPTRGEVPLTVLGTIMPSAPADTSPLMGDFAATRRDKSLPWSDLSKKAVRAMPVRQRGCWGRQCCGSNTKRATP